MFSSVLPYLCSDIHSLAFIRLSRSLRSWQEDSVLDLSRSSETHGTGWTSVSLLWRKYSSCSIFYRKFIFASKSLNNCVSYPEWFRFNHSEGWCHEREKRTAYFISHNVILPLKNTFSKCNSEDLHYSLQIWPQWLLT